MHRICFFIIGIVFIGCAGGRQIVLPPDNPVCQVNPVDQTTLDDLNHAVEDILEYRLSYWVMAPVADTLAMDAGLIEITRLLNEELSGYFRFDYGDIVYYMESNYDLDYAIDNDGDTRADLVERLDTDIEDIKIVILPTNTSLRGYTTTFTDYHKGYVKYAPRYDFIFLSDISVLEQNRDLIHEIGHYFSMPHTFDIKDWKTFEELGLTDAHKICVNDMNYTCVTTGLTPQQKARMWNFGAMYRHNGIQK